MHLRHGAVLNVAITGFCQVQFVSPWPGYQICVGQNVESTLGPRSSSVGCMTRSSACLASKPSMWSKPWRNGTGRHLFRVRRAADDAEFPGFREDDDRGGWGRTGCRGPSHDTQRKWTFGQAGDSWSSRCLGTNRLLGFPNVRIRDWVKKLLDHITVQRQFQPGSL